MSACELEENDAKKYVALAPEGDPAIEMIKVAINR